MFEYFKSAIVSALRNRIIYALIVFALAILWISWLSANFSSRHPQTLALDIGISGIRLLAIMIGLYWIQELIAKDIEQKAVYHILAYPRSRNEYLFGRFFGILFMVGIVIAITGGMLVLLTAHGPLDYHQANPVYMDSRFVMTLFYLWIAVVVITSFALLIATVSTVPMLAIFLGIGFAIVASSVGPTLDAVLNSIWSDDEIKKQYGAILDIVLLFVPDLSQLDIRQWTLYGSKPDQKQLVFAPLISVAYILIMCGLASFRFNTRQFS